MSIYNPNVTILPGNFSNGLGFQVQPKYNVPNKKVGTEPFPSKSIDRKITKGLLEIQAKGKLQALKVIFGSAEYSEGSVVYVRSDRFKYDWGQEELDLDGVKFILVPEDQIVLVDRFPTTTFQVTAVPETPVTP